MLHEERGNEQFSRFRGGVGRLFGNMQYPMVSCCGTLVWHWTARSIDAANRCGSSLQKRGRRGSTRRSRTSPTTDGSPLSQMVQIEREPRRRRLTEPQ